MLDMISAICVSKPSRFGFLQRAVCNFALQDYENRELIIAIADEDYYRKVLAWLANRQHVEKSFSAGFDLSNVSVVPCNSAHLGRNAAEAFAQSSGDYIAVWSDDNLSHSSRLSSQVEKSKECATVVSTSFYYFYDSEELFITDYRQPGRTSVDKCAVSSLIIPRADFCCDSLIAGSRHSHWPSVLVKKLSGSFPFQPYCHLPEKEDGFLFMQGAGNDNLRTTEYHRTIGSRLPLTWTREQILSWSHTIDEVLAGYMFSGESVDVSGKDAAACVISGANIHRWPSWLDPVISDEKLALNTEG